MLIWKSIKEYMTNQEIHNRLTEYELCTIKPILIRADEIVKPEIDKDTVEFLRWIQEKIFEACGIPKYLIEGEYR